MTIAERLAAFMADLTFDQLPKEVVESVRDRIMDTLGICWAGRYEDAVLAADAVIEEWGGRGLATVIGRPASRPPASAALVNGTAAHALDFDDTHLPSIVHPSAVLVPGVIAQAEGMGSSGTEVIAALAGAYEVCSRLSLAQFSERLGNSVMFEHGLHATSIIGAISGAAACARMRGLEQDAIADAVAIAASMGAGLIESNRSGGTVKKFHAGWAAHASVTAAAAAAHGLTGPRTVFEGRFGFFEAFCRDEWDKDAATAGLGERWDTPGIFFKPYPCNHFTHALVDAAIALRLRGVVPSEVVAVVLGTAGPTWRTIGDPIEQKRHPMTPYQAQFSAPWVFATALAGGGGLGVSFEDFAEAALEDRERRRIAGLAEVVVDDECNRIFPHQFPAVARVTLRDGRELVEKVLVNRGGPNRPLSHRELLQKLETTAGPRAARLATALQNLEAAPSVAAVMETCCA